MKISDKTIVITGANSGIGKETAKALGAMGAKIVLVCRDEQRGRKALEELSSVNPGKYDLLIYDLSSLKSVESLARALKEKYPRIDVLLHNAGVFYEKEAQSADGIEMTLAVNHVGVFHLTNLLLDHLVKSSPSRIVIVSSALHKKGKGHFLNERKSYNGMKAYNESKLMNLLFMKKLEQRLTGTGVTINCLHPGVVATGIAGNSGFLYRLGSKIIAPFVLTPAQGALNSIHVASAPELEKVSGKYFEKQKISEYNKRADDEKLADSIWSSTEELIRSSL